MADHVSDGAHFVGAAPQLAVPNVREAARYYEQALGFRVLETFGDPPEYATLSRGDVEVHLRRARRPAPAAVYVWVEGLDPLMDDLARRATPYDGPFEQPYGMKEIVVRDPGGNEITFGEHATDGSAA
jgi:catechol 2,3-dioxygenase-like lactoylglutathione lyase family enzyme